jgi:hypothetical protein
VEVLFAMKDAISSFDERLVKLKASQNVLMIWQT